MFRHRGAILTELLRTKEYKASTLTQAEYLVGWFVNCKNTQGTILKEYQEVKLCINPESWMKLICKGRSQWPRALRRSSVTERLLGWRVRIPPGAWMFVSFTVFVLSGRGLCDGPIPRPEESYRLWCVSECEQVKINNHDTCCGQVEEGRTTKRNELICKNR
jgi:hypothetical protein